MLELRDVSKSYGETVALHPLSLSFPAGKTTALLGASGCGKSTLLRIIVGLVSADSGCVSWDDQPLGRDNIRAARRRMGYMIQDGGLFPHLTLRDNVTLMARQLRWSPSKISERLDELVRLTHLPATSLDRFPTQVSGGQRQRVALMRALFLDPALLLLDEPMGALDPVIRADLQNELRDIFRSLNKTVVMVTHDLDEAGFLADQIVLLHAGRVVQQGPMSDLIHNPADDTVRRFIRAQRRFHEDQP
ncbi:MAG: ATP-binding cassette domain-containing protein [Planctomycetales bacterium]|nr:ATP-binding cassette domain-containing protein [Planctomycetales bacterium]